jgi:acyl-CoA synthetase (NDP forming)/RimJ/RimL family protein N-acetyltransferase
MDPSDGDVPGRAPAGYPAGFETDVVLADGATASVRPIRPDDGPLIVDFHARQSPESIYFRYFSPRPRLTDRDVERATNVDYVDRFALVAVRGDELIGVARYDRWRHRAEAEVAFFVDDANHGRGLATVLLEHLAVRAREVGLRGFTASVLPDNRRMIGVFTQAGFETATRFADGVIEVRLDLQPTPEAEAAIEARARTAAAEAVRRLLSPRSVAVIGAGRDPDSLGHRVLRQLQRAGFAGPVWPVNPNAHDVASVRAVRSILDIDEEVDLAVVSVPAASVAAVVEECGRKQVYGVVILSAGFAETGPEGEALEAEVLRTARSWGIRVVGPNCLGLINTDSDVRLHATFADVPTREGRLSLLSESGMLGAVLVTTAHEQGLGLSSFLALGNRSDVSGNDLLQYWEGDDTTDVVGMYIESFGNPRNFSRLARRLTRAKPVVAVKAGRLVDGEGPEGDVTEDALLRQTGVIRVPTLGALVDTARLLLTQPLPVGRRVAVLGNAGGSLAIAADAARRAHLELAALEPATIVAAEAPAAGEPAQGIVDLGPHATAPEVARATAALVADPGVDALLVLYTEGLGATIAEAVEAISSATKERPEVPVVVCAYGPSRARPADVPVYDAIDAAASALGAVTGYALWRAEPEGEPLTLDDHRVAAVRALVQEHLGRGLTELGDVDALGLLDAAGLVVLRTEVVDDTDAALAAARSIGYPVVLKAAGRAPTAKTAAAGFAIDLEGPDAVAHAWERMVEGLGAAVTPVLVQPMLPPGSDVAVRVRDHPTVGPVLSIGPGGAAAAHDVPTDVRVLPLTDLDAQRFVAGSRVRPALDLDHLALERALLRIAALVEDVPEMTALTVNPLIVKDGRAVVTQARAEIHAVERDPLPPVRRA